VTDNNGGKQIFDISTASSYLSSNDVRVIAGVGSVSKVKTIEVKWPSGLIQKITNPRLNRYVTISEANANQPRGNGR